MERPLKRTLVGQMSWLAGKALPGKSGDQRSLIPRVPRERRELAPKSFLWPPHMYCAIQTQWHKHAPTNTSHLAHKKNIKCEGKWLLATFPSQAIDILTYPCLSSGFGFLNTLSFLHMAWWKPNPGIHTGTPHLSLALHTSTTSLESSDPLWRMVI